MYSTIIPASAGHLFRQDLSGQRQVRSGQDSARRSAGKVRPYLIVGHTESFDQAMSAGQQMHTESSMQWPSVMSLPGQHVIRPGHLSLLHTQQYDSHVLYCHGMYYTVIPASAGHHVRLGSSGQQLVRSGQESTCSSTGKAHVLSWLILSPLIRPRQQVSSCTSRAACSARV